MVCWSLLLSHFSYFSFLLKVSKVVYPNVSLVCRYYKTKGVLPPTRKYESSTASTLVA